MKALEVIEVSGLYAIKIQTDPSYFWGDEIANATRDYLTKKITQWCLDNGTIPDVRFYGEKCTVVFLRECDATLFYLAHA